MNIYQEALDRVRENLRELASSEYYGSSDLATLQELVGLLEKYEIEDLVELEIALEQYYHRYDKVETRRVDSNE